MITRDADAFLSVARAAPVDRMPLPSAAFLIAPEGMTLAAESAQDNRYMAMAEAFSAERALAEHRALAQAIRAVCPVIVFPGDPVTPDAVFPNNVFATAPGRLVIGHMLHSVRQREAERADIRGFFSDALGREVHDLRTQPGVCELTGSLVIDRARGLGFCGLSERCDETGAAAMHAAFDLRATYVFDLAPGEYHTNVLLQIYAGRLAVACPDGLQAPDLPRVLQALYGDQVLLLDATQRGAYAGNGIALASNAAFLSQRAVDSLAASQRAAFTRAGFTLHAVAMPEIEKAGGSLRCCVGEIY